MPNRLRDKRKPTKATVGPCLQVAAFCDSVVQGVDGAYSAIRMIDRVTVKTPDQVTKDMGAIVHVAVLIAFKSVDFKGKKELRVMMVSPDGKRKVMQRAMLKFEGGEHGASAQINLHLVLRPD